MDKETLDRIETLKIINRGRWEYKRETIKFPLNTDDHFKAMGEDGWQLVHYSCERGDTQLIWKRKI